MGKRTKNKICFFLNKGKNVFLQDVWGVGKNYWSAGSNKPLLKELHPVLWAFPSVPPKCISYFENVTSFFSLFFFYFYLA